MKEYIYDLKQCFERLYNYINDLELTENQVNRIFTELDKLEDLIVMLESFSEGIL